MFGGGGGGGKEENAPESPGAGPSEYSEVAIANASYHCDGDFFGGFCVPRMTSAALPREMRD